MRKVNCGITACLAALTSVALGSASARAAETITAAAPPPAASSHPDVWQFSATFQNSFGGEHLQPYRRNMLIDAAKAKLELRVAPVSVLRFGTSVIGKDYYGTTIIPADSYLPDESRASLISADPAADRPGTADLIAFPLSRQLQL